MEKFINKINTLWGITVAACSTLFGGFWYLFAAFLILNAVDYITGVIKARVFYKENSNKGLRGIIKKVGYWVVIALSFFIGFSFESMGSFIGVNLGFIKMVGWFTLATFIINEIRSILENLVILGVDVPIFLTKGLEAYANAVNEKTSESIAPPASVKDNSKSFSNKNS